MLIVSIFFVLSRKFVFVLVQCVGKDLCRVFDSHATGSEVGTILLSFLRSLENIRFICSMCRRVGDRVSSTILF